MTPSSSILQPHNDPLKKLQCEARSRDPSAVAGASILASLSNAQKRLSLLSPPHNALQTETPALPVDTKDDQQKVPFDEKAYKDTLSHELRDAKSHELRLSMRMRAAEMDISKLLDKTREMKELLKNVNLPIPLSARNQAYKDTLSQRILDPNMIEVSFDNFPYYIRCSL